MILKFKRSRIIALSIVSFIVLFLITTLMVVMVVPYFYAPNNKKTYPNWMKDLDDNKAITELVLPGTHDSTTNICDLPYFTKTQNTTIAEQLNIGVRTFDMRLVIEKEKIKFTHSSFNCKENAFKNLYLDKVCTLMYDFLDKNPTEAIIFIAKQEAGKEPISELDRIFEATIKEKMNYWYLSNTVPLLKDVRGKIVLLTRYDSKYGMNIYWSDQGNKDNTSLTYDKYTFDSYNAYIQDRYKYKKDVKWEAFTSDIGNIPENTFVLNYLSTTEGGLTNPRNIANSLNKKFMEYTIPNSFKGSIMLDYINSNLVERIINAN